MNALQKKNDEFRKNVLVNPVAGGHFVMTMDVFNLEEEDIETVKNEVSRFDVFNQGNDPHKEHDLGMINIPGIGKIMWKIDYYQDARCEYGAEDPMNCYRVLTLMFASNY